MASCTACIYTRAPSHHRKLGGIAATKNRIRLLHNMAKFAPLHLHTSSIAPLSFHIRHPWCLTGLAASLSYEYPHMPWNPRSKLGDSNMHFMWQPPLSDEYLSDYTVDGTLPAAPAACAWPKPFLANGWAKKRHIGTAPLECCWLHLSIFQLQHSQHLRCPSTPYTSPTILALSGTLHLLLHSFTIGKSLVVSCALVILFLQEEYCCLQRHPWPITKYKEQPRRNAKRTPPSSHPHKEEIYPPAAQVQKQQTRH